MYPSSFISSLNKWGFSAIWKNVSSHFDANLDRTAVEPTSFEDLSDDILLEIFYLLDLRSILRLRGTNRRLRTLSTTYSIWSGALQHLDKACPTRGFLDLERPLSSYSSRKVEQMVTKAVRVEEAWRRPTLTPTRIRKIRCIDGLRAAEFLPGGRWLLLSTMIAAEGLDYYDLEQEQLEPRYLFPEGDHVGNGIPDDMAIDIKTKEPVLTFHLALIVREPHDPGISVRHYTLSYWKVTLDDTHDGLSSTHLTTVKFIGGSEPITRKTMALSDGLLVRTAWIGRRISFELLEWDFKDSWRKALFVPPGKTFMASDLHLLPGRRLLVLYYDQICIYNIPELVQVGSPADAVPEVPWEPTWRYPFKKPSNRNMLSTSRPFQTIGSVTVAMLFNAVVVHRFTITTDDVNVETFPIDPHNANYHLTACLGRSRGLRWQSYDSNAGIFSWVPGEESRAFQAFGGIYSAIPDASLCKTFLEGKFEFQGEPGGDPGFFDERAGRALVPLKRVVGADGIELLVLDFA